MAFSEPQSDTFPRFNIDFTEEELTKFIDQQENVKTKRKTEYDVQLFRECIQAANPELLGGSTSIHDLSPTALNDVLSKFIYTVRKKDRSEYEPTTLRGFLASIQHYLNRQNYGFIIFKDAQFKGAMATLKAKQKDLKAKGFGNKPKTSDLLTDEEIEKLYDAKCLGIDSPQATINTLWLKTTIHFGLRGGKEQRDLCWGDDKLKQNAEGKEYLEYSVERQTKTRGGSEPRNTRKVKPKMYSQPELGAERDPVRVYKLYASKRPANTNRDDLPFYLATNAIQCSTSTKPWFKAQPIGINKLNSLLKTMANEANLVLDPSKRLTNHSARKHLVQKLDDNKVPATHIMQITGHRNVNSVNNYSALSDDQQEKISNILSFRDPRPSSATCTTTKQLSAEEYQCVRSVQKMQTRPNKQL